MKKKAKHDLRSDVSILIVAVLAVLAFFRNNTQAVLLAIAFGAWCIYAACRYLLPMLKRLHNQREVKKLRRYYEQEKQNMQRTSSGDTSIVMLRHANHRISAALRAVYPDATWEWCTDDPEALVANGGVACVRLYGVTGYNYAEVTMNRDAKISFQLMQMAPLSTDAPAADDAKPLSHSREIDPQVWYEQQGKLVLTNLIADLNSRGHSTLTILEDGDISIMQADQELRNKAFASIPERTYWPRLVKLFEREGIAADATTQGITLTW